MVETLPILSRALRLIVQLVGTPQIEAEDDVKADLVQWMQDVVVSRITTGFDNWFAVWLYDSLLYGRSHAEIILPVSRKDIYAIQELHPRTIDLRPTLDGYSLDIVQIMAMRGMWITLNKRLIVTATHNLAVDMPHGRSLLYGLPFIAEIVVAMCKDHKRLWERFGNPSYHINYVPPPTLPDPTGARGQAFIGAMMNQWNQLMQQRANGLANDFGTSGDVKVEVIGAKGEALEFKEPYRELVSQLIAATGLPPFMLGQQWQTTEAMSAVEGGLLSEMIAQIRTQCTPELMYLLRMRQLLAGKSDKFGLSWKAPTLIDLFENARAELFQEKATAQKIANLEDLWRTGVIENWEFAQALKPELKGKTKEEILALLPGLAAEPPAPAQPGSGFGAELMPDQAAGAGAKSLTYGWAMNGNGRH